MAEKFNDYLTSVTYSSGKTIVIVPPATELNSLPYSEQYAASGTRVVGSTCQLHSIYITMSDVDNFSHDPEDDAAIISLYIQNTVTNTNNIFYLAKNIKVLPNSSFYIEKTITLNTQECLKLVYHGVERKGEDVTPGTIDTSITHKIDTVCSSVDITSSN